MNNSHLNMIILHGNGEGTFLGPLGCAYAHRSELWLVLEECFQAAQRSQNRYFVLEGGEVRAAQTTLTGAMRYMQPTCTLLDCSVVPEKA